MARPAKLNASTHATIVRAVEAGTPIKYAAAYAGVSEATVYRWLQRGAEPTAASEYREFCEEVQRAQARSVTRLVAQVAEQDWRAAAWLLIRRAPEDFVSPERRGDLTRTAADGEVGQLEAQRRLRYLERRLARESDGGR